MPNLLETIQDMNSTSAEVKTNKELLIEAASSKHSSKFVRIKVDVTKVPLLATGDPQGELVIDVNASSLRKTKSGFTPRIIIMSGSDKLRAAKAAHQSTCLAWVGTRILSNTKKYPIVAAGETFNPDVLLDKYQTKQEIDQLHDTPNAGITQGGRPAGHYTMGYDVRNYGAPGSELNNPAFKLMLNVEEALSMYQKEKANGTHKVIATPYAEIPLAYVNAGREAKIAAAAAGLDLNKFSVMDFLKWQDAKVNIRAADQRKNGLDASAYAYVGDNHDISTWHCPKNTIAAAKVSLNTLARNRCVPKDEKDVVKDLLISAGGGPHLGKGTPAKRHLDKLNGKDKGKDKKTKKVKAGGPGSGRTADFANTNSLPGSGNIDKLMREREQEKAIALVRNTR